MEQNNKARCPICGKFANQAMIDKYNALVRENGAMRNELIVKKGIINALKAENERYKKENEQLNYAKKSALDELERNEVKEFFGIKFKIIIPTDREIGNDAAGKPTWKTSYLMQNTGCAKCAFHIGSHFNVCGEYTDWRGHLPCFVPRLNKEKMQFTYCSIIDDCKATVQ